VPFGFKPACHMSGFVLHSVSSLFPSGCIVAGTAGLLLDLPAIPCLLSDRVDHTFSGQADFSGGGVLDAGSEARGVWSSRCDPSFVVSWGPAAGGACCQPACLPPPSTCACDTADSPGNRPQGLSRWKSLGRGWGLWLLTVVLILAAPGFVWRFGAGGRWGGMGPVFPGVGFRLSCFLGLFGIGGFALSRAAENKKMII